MSETTNSQKRRLQALVLGMCVAAMIFVSALTGGFTGILAMLIALGAGFLVGRYYG